MHGGPDPLGASTSSFTARRSAASNLPGAFELPPPNPLQNISTHKYPGFSTNNSSQPPMNANGIASAGVGNLLTPPNTLAGDYNPLSPSTHASAANQANAHGYNANSSYWSQPSQQSAQTAQYAPYSAPAGNTPQQQAQPWIPPRGMFNSPSSLNGMVSESKPQPQSHDLYQLPPFGSSSMSAPSSIAAVTPGQGPPSASPASSHEPFHMRSSSTSSSYYQPHNTVHPFPTGPSPTQQSHARMSPLSAPHEASSLYGSAQSQAYHQRSAYGQYPVSSVGAPVMNGMHNGQMGMVSGMSNGMMGGYSGGHAASMQHMYSLPHHGTGQVPNDRPFKCDQCQQSFNRNHDLKRHKRIHLAVKPYPCGHCDKSFSRKDALKRHILVKGCGKALTGAEHERTSDPSSSPVSTKSGGTESKHTSMNGLQR